MSYNFTASLPQQYGPLQLGLLIEFDNGYNAFVGKNNSGKSAILQFLTNYLYERVPKHEYVYIPTQRHLTRVTSQIGQTSLAAWNEQLRQKIINEPARSENIDNLPPVADLFATLFHEVDLYKQVGQVTEILAELGFPDFRIGQGQNLYMSDHLLAIQGSGLRTLAPIVSAISSKNIKYIFIDEPELSLEPNAQKLLAQLLRKFATDKTIIVATHSHLFLNRERIENNMVVERSSSGEVAVSHISSQDELLKITYDLLGNSLSDLFFPNNFIIVEGASDQALVEKIISLLGYTTLDLKPISATGIDRATNLARCIIDALKPISAGKSPYRSTAVVLVDRNNLTELKQNSIILEMTSDGRFIELGSDSLEAYIDESLYTKAGLVRADALEKLSQLRNYHEISAYKKEISDKIVEHLEESDLEKIPDITNAVKKGLPAQGQKK